MSKFLLVEDDPSFAQDLILALNSMRFSVDHAKCAREAVEFLQVYEYDLIILDWELPERSGPDLCQQIKKEYAQIPVIMLTGRLGPSNTVFGLDAGADDYVEKPCNIAELTARIRAILRRPRSEDSSILECGQLRIVKTAHEAQFFGNSLNLSAREFELLQFFLKHPDTLFSADTLFIRIWTNKSEVSPELVRVYVKRLRDKLVAATGYSPIETVSRSGYILSSSACSKRPDSKE